MMWVRVALLGACLAGFSSGAWAQAQVIGKGFDNWSFTQEKEGKGVVNCRANHRVGGRDDIMAMRTDGHSYLSVRAEGRKAKYRNSIIVPLREPANGQQWDNIMVEANGARMWVEMPPAAIEIIAARGGYSMLLGGTEDRDDVNLGKSAAAAWKRVKECVVNNGG
jgi:hypothetical protein